MGGYIYWLQMLISNPIKVADFYSHYPEEQKRGFSTNILKVFYKGELYQTTRTQKLDTLLYDHCQLIVRCDSFGIHWLGYTFTTKGFPHLANVAPIFFCTITIDQILEMHSEGVYLTIKLKVKKQWKFKFVEEGIAAKWMDLLANLRQAEHTKDILTTKGSTQSISFNQSQGNDGSMEELRLKAQKWEAEAKKWKLLSEDKNKELVQLSTQLARKPILQAECCQKDLLIQKLVQKVYQLDQTDPDNTNDVPSLPKEGEDIKEIAVSNQTQLVRYKCRIVLERLRQIGGSISLALNRSEVRNKNRSGAKPLLEQSQLAKI